MRFVGLSIVSAVLLTCSGTAVAQTPTDEAPDDAPARLSVNAEARPTGGADVEALHEAPHPDRLTLSLVCRDGERVLGERDGPPPRVRLVLDPLATTLNATCEARASTASGEAVLLATRSVTVPAAASDDEGDGAWILWVAGGSTVAAAIAIVVAIAVASASSPVNVGAPTVDGW